MDLSKYNNITNTNTHLEEVLQKAPLLLGLSRGGDDGVGGHHTPVAAAEVTDGRVSTVVAYQLKVLLSKGACGCVWVTR